MKKIGLLLTSALIGFHLPTFAADKPNTTDATATIPYHKAVRAALDWELAPIKSRAALDQPINQDSPLGPLSPKAQQRFIDSIVFRENGLGGFYYGDLEAELTPTEIYAILALFGAQRVVPMMKNARIETSTDALLLSKNQAGPAGYPGDHEGYMCIGDHTCEASTVHICMSRG